MNKSINKITLFSIILFGFLFNQESLAKMDDFVENYRHEHEDAHEVEDSF